MTTSSQDSPSPADVKHRTFALKPQGRFGRDTLIALGLTLLATTGLVFAWYQNARLGPVEEGSVATGLVLAVAIPLALVLLPSLIFKRPRAGLQIVVGRGGVLFPNLASEAFVVQFDEIQNLELRAGKVLVLESDERKIMLPVRAFETPSDAAALLAVIREAIGALPDGRGRLAEIDRLGTLASSVLERRPMATWALFAILGVTFAIEHVAGAFDWTFGVVRIGANAHLLVREGQIDRLLSSTFLHAGLLHLYLSAAALLGLGMLLERIVGTATFVVVFFASMLGGSLASAAAAESAFTLGASPALFGLAGSLGVLNVHYGRDLPFVFRRRWSWWVLVLGVNAFLPLLVPQIDAAAHAGGMIAGGLMTYAIVADRPITPSGIPSSRLIAGVAVLVGLLSAASVVLTVQRARDPGAEALRAKDDRSVVASFLSDPELGPEEINRVAWELAIAPDASRPLLEIARRSLAAALAKSRDDGHLQDTLATLELRLGHLDDAVDLERRALASAARALAAKPGERRLLLEGVYPLYATQLGRFLLARGREATPSLHPRLVDAGTTKKLRLDATGLEGQRVHAFVLAVEGVELRGILEVCIGPAHGQHLELDVKGDIDWPNSPNREGDGARAGEPSGARLLTGLVDASMGAATSEAACALDGGDASVQAWKAVPAALALPSSLASDAAR